MPRRLILARILYFASLADQLGRASEDVDLPGSVTDIATLLAWLRKRGGKWDKLLADDRIKVTVDRQFAEPGMAVANTSEVAIIGGASG